MRYRTLWISDVHLGRSGCQAEMLSDFLQRHSCERLYLVGDIIDGWKLRQHWFWPQAHANVVRAILSKAEQGTAIYYITGNHDEFMRRYVEHALQFGNISIANEAVHHTADGRRLLVVHGDAFDMITRYFRRVAVAGDAAYQLLMRANAPLNAWRRRQGLEDWSISAYAKHQVKRAVNFVSAFEDAVARDCRRRKLDGVICGHIHHAEIREIHGVQYHNCGDWVESCTALAEDANGTIRVLRVEDWYENSVQSDKVTPLREAPRKKAAGVSAGLRR
ncbi:UDP-2,3-diacylglucosamine pyrophosphatase LpxH [Solimonas aquatica]|uniref:UDP-2,3-diacylglucosamine pyrophosphatase LpxH n=1 Tax=Solimonas aquatica TaxID=489703 RepID=A0A1H9CQQ5_9GAMM|nr:UDP-2,3-diacylglucosamine diphosphatase [Solimonas aquatica]SEQ03441.1 UDP-2,3-diacylglucosamine pyrophosphatase LpxH [Solimonas aquatica]